VRVVRSAEVPNAQGTGLQPTNPQQD
jgi:hypothetical protein